MSDNIGKDFDDNGYATFLPAISSFYTRMLKKSLDDPDIADRIPKGFERGLDGMDFVHGDGYFNYDKCLYSAGHAYLDLDKFEKAEPLVQPKDGKKTVLLGDSGGFQIGKGVIKFDWERFYEEEDKPETWVDGKYIGDADATRMKILRWLEYTSEWSMILDVPTWSAAKENRDKTGLKGFDDCLNATIHNNDFFVKNRVEGGTKFLNVLQGGDFTEATAWYDAVKHYPFEGWAFGGNNMRDMTMALKRIIILRDEGLLQDRDWIHFLGTSRLDWACMLTAVQRQIRKHINPNLTISFDCASPFIATANGLSYSDYILTPDKWTYPMGSMPDSRDLVDSEIPFPFESEIGKRLKMKDLCHWGPGVPNKQGNITASSWDSFSYLLVMAHNVNQHIRSVQDANKRVDVEKEIHKPNVRDWKKLKGNDKSGELSAFVPRNLLYFNTFIEELFVHENPLQFIDDNAAFLDAVSYRRNVTGNTLVFNQLFDEKVDSGDDTTFEGGDTASLSDLEDTV